MVKRAINIPTFNPKDTLKDIREKSLNPVIQRVLDVEGNIETVIAPTQRTVYKNVTFDEKTSRLTFEKVGKGDATPQLDTVIDLSSIVPQFAGINVKGYGSGSGEVRSTSNIKFEDASISKDVTDDYANVVYDWSDIVPKNQTPSTVTLSSLTNKLKYTNIKIESGSGGGRYFTHTGTDGGVLTINMPLIPDQMTAQVVGGSSTDIKPIKKIKITGVVGGSTIDGDELQIDLPSGGGTFTVGYFKGFYNDVDSIPKDNLFEDRSSAYVKMEVEGITVYVLHMWRGTSGGWIQVTSKPPLIYNPQNPGEPKQAVLSVKWNKDITLSTTGELDLSGLENHEKQAPGYIGIFESLVALKEFKDPVQDKSMALVRDADLNVFISYTFRIGDDTAQPAEWLPTPAEGSLKFFDKTVSKPAYKPMYGVNGGSGITLDSNGMLNIKPSKKGTIQIKAKVDEDHEEKEKAVKGLHFIDGIFVDTVTENEWAVIKHPQRVVHYNDTFESKYNSSIYMGNIFFDTTSSSWIGWSEGKDGAATVTPKWTPIAHRGMSEQVTSLNYRHPKENTPIISTDDKNTVWGQSGMTYLSKDDDDLPEGLKGKTGAFVKTDVKKNTAASGNPSDEIRVQMCRPDGGADITGAWMRSYDTPGAKWNSWIQTSFTQQDLNDHKVDPNAHSNILRYYRTYAVLGNVDSIFKQVLGDTTGGLIAENGLLLADNYGYAPTDSHDYLDAPYTGQFNISGVIAFGGYNDDKKKPLPSGEWRVLVRKRSNTTGSDYTSLGHFTCKYVAPTGSGKKRVPFPNLLFRLEDVHLESHQEVIFNINYVADGTTPPGPGSLTKDHEYLYIVGQRSNIVIEDNKTKAGSYIAKAQRLLYGNTESIGDTGAVIRHTFINDLTSGVRVLGEKSSKAVTIMTKYD